MRQNNPTTFASVATPSATKALMKKHQIVLKKSLGQNFITDQNILQKIIDAAQLDNTKGVIEIGPGIGALTQQLARVAGKVLAIEIDQRLLPVLAETLAPYPHTKIIHGDILKIDLKDYIQSEFESMTSISVVANLPYYITTPIIFKLLEEKLPIENIVIMIQKEVAERIHAQPGTKDYGSLSIAIQYHCHSEIICVVPRTVFVPEPHVDSAIIRLKLRTRPAVHVENEAFFFEVVRSCFVQRRKTILNNLSVKFSNYKAKLDLKAILLAIGIDPTRRAETLSIDEYAQLAVALTKQVIESNNV